MESLESKSSNFLTFRNPLRGFERGVTEGLTAFKVDRVSHGINFLIYMTPFFGMVYKAYEVITAPHQIKTTALSAKDETTADELVNRAVRNYQVDDVLFGLASSVEFAVSMVLGIVSIYFLPFVIFSLVVKTSLLVMNKEGLYEGYLRAPKVEVVEPSKEVKPYKDRFMGLGNIAYAAVNTLIYCIPMYGTKVKKDLTLQLRAEYINKDVSPERQKQIEKIQRVHDYCFFFAKGISLTIIMSICGLLMAHPLALTVIGISVVTSAYFSGKIDMVEVRANDLSEWKRLSAINKKAIA